MGNELIPFIFDDKPVRAVVIDGAEYWVARDVIRILGYKNENEAIKDHCDGVAKRYPIVDSMGRTQEVRVINEPDLFRLIIKSRLPEAERFERWVFEEVLPQIRKTGAYGADRKEAEALREQNSRLIFQGFMDTQLLERAEQEIRRYRDARVMTARDKIEIVRLLLNGYSIERIHRATKKGRTAIKKFLDWFKNGDEAEVDAEWQRIKALARGEIDPSVLRGSGGGAKRYPLETAGAAAYAPSRDEAEGLVKQLNRGADIRLRELSEETIGGSKE